MAVIQNIFKNLEYKLDMMDEIKLFKWSQKPIKEKLAQLIEWNEELTPEHILVKAAEQILELNYPTEYMKYSAMQQKFKHSFPFYMEKEIEDVSSFIDWINSIFDYFDGLEEGLLGGLVVTPVTEGALISCEYEKGKLQRVLNKGDGDDAELILNLMDLPSIPQELSIKKNVTVRGIITLKDKSKKPKNTTMTAYVNEIIFNENADDSDLIFIPNEWLTKDKKIINTSKKYQILKDNGFIVPSVYKADQVIKALEKFEEYMATEFDFDVYGCRFEVEKGDTVSELMDIVREENLSEYLHKIILLG